VDIAVRNSKRLDAHSVGLSKKASSPDRAVGWVWHIAELFGPGNGSCDPEVAKEARKELHSLDRAER
jgi:hypothetical protein